MDPLLEANGNFAIKLFKVLCEDRSKNVFFSPPSISSALSMILMGANGITASQICQVTSTIVKQINTGDCQLSWSSIFLNAVADDKGV